jgi:PhoH-like ATPase
VSKVYIVDTNVLAHDYNAIDNLLSKDATICVPYVVLEELDGLKVRQDQVGRNVRHAIKQIEELYNTKISICDSSDFVSDSANNDDKIIAVVDELDTHTGINPIIVSKDIALRLKAKAQGKLAEDYRNDKVDTERLYSGFGGGYPNEVNDIDELYLHKPFGLLPANEEQLVAMEHCLNKDIPLVTLVGGAGTGKTLCALACALDLVMEQQAYDMVTIARPIMPFQKDIGYIPGEVEDKLAPWFGPIRDNIDYLFSMSEQPKTKRGAKIQPYEELISWGILEFQPLTYIRGRSLARRILIVDEAQNCSPSELRTIITRVGENSKIILTGDYSQIDSPYLSADTNGLVYCVDRFKDSQLSAHVTLKECKRSALASEAAERL